MIDRGIVAMLSELTAERELDKEFVLEILKESIITAAKKQYGLDESLECEISEASGKITLYREKTVKKEVKDQSTEISLEEARRLKPTIALGATFKEEIPIEEFGRNAINIVKNTLIQKIKTNEKEMLYEKYKNKEGELVSGTVSRIYSTGAYVKIGDIEAFLPREEQIPEERLRRGNPIKALIKDITTSPKEGDEERIRIKGPIVYLSRIEPEFVLHLLEFETPEVLHSEVEIKGIARKAGTRTKVAVYSKNEKIDAVGSCVGHRGNRIQSIVRELSGERVDVIRWEKDKAKQAAEALSPVKVVESKMINEKKVLCIVPDDELTGAIGKVGENVSLAAELTGLNIEIRGRSEYRKEIENERRKKVTIDKLTISDYIKKLLKNAGYKNAQDIVAQTREELMEIKGLGNRLVDKIYSAINKTISRD
ncbi:MAG: transcription termination factor NusA [candidate division WOR-3 bacterium]|nr:transcription termination factor NusA [candidate division WOR-3 bacterium]